MKDFNYVYQKIQESDSINNIEETRKNSLKQANKKKLQALIIGIIICLLICVLKLIFLLPFAIIISVLFLLLGGYSSTKSYKKEYKEKVIASLVSNYDENLSFTGENRIPRQLYNAAEFESYDNFYSNDYIHGKLEGYIPIELGDVHTEDQHTDSDGNTTYTTVFRGLFSAACLPKSLESTVKIRSDKGMLGKLLSKKELVTMDSQEFEKFFDVFSNNKILAVRILTSDIMNYMIDFKKDNKVNFEITAKNNYIYLRIHCDDMFEGKMSKSALDRETLYKYYRFLNFMCELNKKIYDVIQEKDI